MQQTERPTLMKALGNMKVVAFDPTMSRVEMAVEGFEAITHSGGIVQGGFVTAWLDEAMAHCLKCSEVDLGPATLEIKVNFLLPAKIGKYRVIAWIPHMGRSLAFFEAELRDQEGQLVATATSTAKLVALPD